MHCKRASQRRSPWRSAVVLAAAALVCATASAADEQAVEANPVDKATVATIIRGKTVCRDTNQDNAICGVEHWTLFVNKSGSRYLQVVSDDVRIGFSRQVMLWIDPNKKVREGYVNVTSQGKFVGSTFVVLRGGKAYVTTDDSEFKGEGPNVRMSIIDQPEALSSIGAGPVSADTVHLMDQERTVGTSLAKSVYWVGGQFAPTMVGGFFESETEFLGRDDMVLANGKKVVGAHFRLKKGSELWVLEPYDILLKMKLQFGPVKGHVYETTELDIESQSF